MADGDGRRKARNVGWAFLGAGLAFAVLGGAMDRRGLGDSVLFFSVVSFVVGSLALAGGVAGGRGLTRVLAFLGLLVLLLAGSCWLFLIGGSV